MPVSDGKYYVRTRILPPSPSLSDASELNGREEDSDVEEYYPYVISHGRDFKLIDPKVYKQLRKHNIRQKTPVRVADCAQKVAQENRRGTGFVRTNKFENRAPKGAGDEYCELSPLAKQPPLKVYSQSLLTQGKISQFNKLPSYEKRLHYDCYKPKDCIVESNPSSPQTNPTTKVLNTDFASKNKSRDEKPDEMKEPVTCFGSHADEAIDCATCMCCAKGLFYHCTKDGEDEGRIAETPCSCAGPFRECAPRWGCLAILALFFPCMLCYPPAIACRKLSKTKSDSRNKKSRT